MTEPLTDAEIAADLSLCEKATPDWRVCDLSMTGEALLQMGAESTGLPFRSIQLRRIDANFASAARTGWPRALEALKEARRESAQIKAWADAIIERYGSKLDEAVKRAEAAEHRQSDTIEDRERVRGVLQARADRAEAALAALKRVTWCAYCQAEFPLDTVTAEQVSEHIRVCPKHPMRAAEAALADRTVERDDAREGWQDMTASANEQRARAEKAEAALVKANWRADNAERCLHDGGECCTACGEESNRQIVVLHDLRVRASNAEAALAGYEQTTGDECPACGWRGVRGDDGCAFCAQEHAHGRADPEWVVGREMLACAQDKLETAEAALREIVALDNESRQCWSAYSCRMAQVARACLAAEAKAKGGERG